jgi:heavy metal sensor kinase
VALSIRWRLTLWNTFALAVVLAGFAALVYGLLARALYEQTDQRLLGGLRQLEQDRRLAADRPGRLRYWADELREHDNLACVAYGPGGEVLVRTNELAQASVPAAPAIAAGVRRLTDRDVPIVGRQRVLEAGVRLGDQDGAVVLLAPLDEVDRELSRLRAALLLAVPVALAVAGGLAYLLARKALAPVEELRRSTRAITADRLDRRLPVPNPGDEFGGLAQAINDMIGRLGQSFAEIRRFTADASHELRTPLTAIRTEAEVALRGPAVPPEQQQLLGSILEECGRLTRLTEQLLALAREDAGVAPPAREPIDLTEVAAEAVDTLRPLAEAKNVRLDGPRPCRVDVCGDAARLRQVFLNLIDNAIKYTPEGGAVEVRCEGRAGEAVALVRDSGVGIPPEHLPHVFDRFYRVDKARDRGQGGTGLGLSIAQSVVAGHGGRIELSSDRGRGTTARVTLPLAAAPPGVARAEVAGGRDDRTIEYGEPS